MGRHTRNMLWLQFLVAGVLLLRFNAVDFKGKDSTWYSDITWTTKQEALYKKILFLYTRVFKIICSQDKKYFDTWFNWWNLDYGFKIKEKK